MMSFIHKYVFLLLGLYLLMASGCKDKWEEHYGEQDPLLAETLLSEIKKNPDLSIFSEYIHATKYDSVLATSKAFTIWAPTNAALEFLDPAIPADPVKLKAFVGNHIVYQSYVTHMADPAIRLESLNNGKTVLFSSFTVEDIEISKSNIYVGNGVLHIIDGAIIPKLNIYEYIESSGVAPKLLSHIKSFDRKVVNPGGGVVLGIDPDTGKPLYEAGTDSIIRNSYLRNTAQINTEDSLFTYVVLKDDAFLAEENKLLPYFKAYNNQGIYKEDSSRFITRNHIVENLAFKGLFLPGNLPDSMLSVRGVNVHLNPSSIIETHRLSNGIAYVVSSIKYSTSKFLGEIIIQGESSVSVSASTANARYTRRNPDGITTYTQQRSTNLANLRSWYEYRTRLNSVKYKVYWRAMRDYDLVPPAPIAPSTVERPLTFFQQRIAFKMFSATDLPYKYVEAQEVLPAPIVGRRKYVPKYEEQYIGTYQVDKFGNESIFLVSNNESVAAGLNNLVLDYIRLIPVTN
ncbi:fasciclin domain-containing protein [Pedobacter sp. P351]|uniref:fasciclin domain-containing protein n=1 Tax=Pedobacter superstes TaxID=3133441 RepID=UPI0030967B3E